MYICIYIYTYVYIYIYTYILFCLAEPFAPKPSRQQHERRTVESVLMQATLGGGSAADQGGHGDVLSGQPLAEVLQQTREATAMPAATQGPRPVSKDQSPRCSSRPSLGVLSGACFVQTLGLRIVSCVHVLRKVLDLLWFNTSINYTYLDMGS